MKLLNIYFCFLFSFFFGCAENKKIILSRPSVPEIINWPFEKSTNQIEIRSSKSLSIQFDQIKIVINSLPPSLVTVADYFFLTGGPFPSGFFEALRKDIKIICPSLLSKSIQEKGFTQVKGLEPSSRLMLKKENHFLFVTALTLSVHGEKQMGYFFEFDHGRHILISLIPDNTNSFREFTYSLRDDGKELDQVYLLDFNELKSTVVSELAGLLQPKALILIKDPKTPYNSVQMKQYLKDQLFEGEVFASSDLPSSLSF
ncbi:MAG: hypothetical protein ACKVQC_03985 [Elusimicrobiota bacterium]